MSDTDESDGRIGNELYTLVGGSTAIFAGRIMGRVGALLGQVLIARALAPGTFGTVALAYTIILLLSRVTSNGFREGVARFISLASDPVESLEYLKSGAVTALALSLITATGVYLFQPWLGRLLGTDSLSEYLLAFIPYLFVFPLGQLLIADFRGRQRTVAPVIAQHIVGVGAGIVAFGVLATVGAPDTGAIAYWYAPSVALVAALGPLVVRRYYGDGAVSWPHRDALETLWSYSWPLLLGGSFAVLLSNIDLVMIGYFSDSVAVGEYRAIQPLRTIAFFLLTSTAFLYLPIASTLYEEGRTAALSNLYKTTTKWVVAGTAPIVLLIALFPVDTVVALFGSDYEGAAVALPALLLGMFGQTLMGPSGVMVKAINQTRAETVGAAIGLAVNLVANLILIPEYGILGAAIGTTAGIIVFNVVETVVIYRVTGASPVSANTVKQLVPSVLLAVGIAYLLRGYRLELRALLLLGVVFVVIQLCSIVATKSLSQRDAELVDSVADQTGYDLSLFRRLVNLFI